MDDKWEMEIRGGRRFALRIFFSVRKIPRVDLVARSAPRGGKENIIYNYLKLFCALEVRCCACVYGLGWIVCS